MSWLSKAKSAASGAVKAGVAAGSAVAAASASAADAINAKLEKDESTGLVPEPPQDLEAGSLTNSSFTLTWSPPEPPEGLEGEWEYVLKYSGKRVPQAGDAAEKEYAKRSGFSFKETIADAFAHDSGKTLVVHGGMTRITLQHLKSKAAYTISVASRFLPRPKDDTERKECEAAAEQAKQLTLELSVLEGELAPLEAAVSHGAAAGDATGGAGGAGDAAVNDARVRELQRERERLQAAVDRATRLSKSSKPSELSAPAELKGDKAVVTLSSDEWEREEHDRRIEEFFSGDGPIEHFPVIYSPDTTTRKALRITNLTVDALNRSGAAGVLGISFWTTSFSVGKQVAKYGLAAAFFNSEIGQACAALVNLAGSARRGMNTSVSDLTAGMYYLLWMHERDRLWSPDLELVQHSAGYPGIVNAEAPTDRLREFARYLAFARWPYMNHRDAIEWVANPAGFELICSSPDSRFVSFPAGKGGVAVVSAPEVDSEGVDVAPDAEREVANRQQTGKPGYHLVANRATRTAVFCVRGTDSFVDCLQDVKADFSPIEYLGKTYWSHGEMQKAARWIVNVAGAGEWATRFANDKSGAPWKLACTGHSLGGGVATLLAIELHRFNPELRLDVYAFAPAAAIDGHLSEALHPDAGGPIAAYSLVNRDDLVPRASAYNARNLFRKLDAFDWSGLKNVDVSAVAARVKGAWRERERRAEMLVSSTGSGATGGAGAAEGKEGEKDDEEDEEKAMAAVQLQSSSRLPSMDSFEAKLSCIYVTVKRATDLRDVASRAGSVELLSMHPYVHVTMSTNQNAPKQTATIKNGGTNPDFSGEKEVTMEFWFNSDRIDDETESWTGTIVAFDYTRGMKDTPLGAGELDVSSIIRARDTSVRDFEVPLTFGLEATPAGTVTVSVRAEFNHAAADMGGVLSPEDITEHHRLPPMACPGEVTHMWCHNGQMRASTVAWNWPGLAKMELQKNAVVDHKADRISRSLRGVVAALDPGVVPPPQWASKAASTNPLKPTRTPCAVCKYATDWTAAAGSEAEIARVTHHCRACGQFVCEPCSTLREALPKHGILHPTRICERCRYSLTDHTLELRGQFSKK